MSIMDTKVSIMEANSLRLFFAAERTPAPSLQAAKKLPCISGLFSLSFANLTIFSWVVSPIPRLGLLTMRRKAISSLGLAVSAKRAKMSLTSSLS